MQKIIECELKDLTTESCHSMNNEVTMKTLKAILSKGPDDFGAWFENMEGVYGAGATVAEAKKNLIDGLGLYAKHNQDAPSMDRK
jgi:predicted RNase H-like HicB family nuclease